MKENEVAKRLLADQKSCFKCSAFSNGNCCIRDDGSIPQELICDRFKEGFFVKWSKESELDLASYHGLSAVDELKKIMIDTMSKQADKIIDEKTASYLKEFKIDPPNP